MLDTSAIAQATFARLRSAARQAVRRAVKSGRLKVPRLCERCGPSLRRSPTMAIIRGPFVSNGFAEPAMLKFTVRFSHR